MTAAELVELTGWLLFAWSVGFGAGKIYVTFRQIGDISS